MEFLLTEIGLVIIASGVIGLFAYIFKQPLILAYILAGVLIGPFGFAFIKDPEFINGISHIGIMLMLFLIGLEMNTERMRELGGVVVIAGVLQVALTGVLSYLLILLFGFSVLESIYMAIAFSFSSTVIAVKIISDKRATNSYFGQLTIGILIVQDVLAIIALLLLSGFQEGSFDFDVWHFAGILGKGVVLASATLFVAHKALKYVYNRIATSNELLILFSLCWCFIVSLLSHAIGFSIEIGAFIAGLSLANLPYTFEINVKAKVLRDFFITIFFASFGAGLMFASIGPYLFDMFIFAVCIIIGTPVLLLIILGALGYDKRTAFFTGISLANISEFSLIIIGYGFALGHVSEEVSALIGMLTIFTMVISSYMLTYNTRLFREFKNHLSIFEFSKRLIRGKKRKKKLSDHIILLGAGEMGEQILEHILTFKDDYVVVDHDNRVINKLMAKNIHCLFGDTEDDELISELDMQDSELIISTLPHSEDVYFFLQKLEAVPEKKRPIFIATAESGRDGLEMFMRGADYVILKPYLGAHHVSTLHKDIYNLEEEIETLPMVSSDAILGIAHSKHHPDHQIARILNKLNNLQLENIKTQFKKKPKARKGKALKISIDKHTISVEGNLHLSNIQPLKKEISKLQKKKDIRKIVIDIQNVHHVDHKVVHILLDIIKTLKKQKKHIDFININPHTFFSKHDEVLLEQAIL